MTENLKKSFSDAKKLNKNGIECNYEDVKSDLLEDQIYLNKPKIKSIANMKILILVKVKFEPNDREHAKKISMKESVWVIKIISETHKDVYSLKGFRLANYNFEKKTE